MPESETSRGPARTPEPTAGPFLTFDLAEQIRELRQESYWQSGRNAKTLVIYMDSSPSRGNLFTVVLPAPSQPEERMHT